MDVRFLRHPTVSIRLAGLGMLAMAITATVGWIGWRGMRFTEASVHHLTEHLAEVDTLKQAHIDILTVIKREHDLFGTKDAAERAEIAANVRELIDRMTGSLQVLEPILVASPDEGSAAGVLSQIPDYRSGVLALAAKPETGDKDIPEIWRLDRMAEGMKKRLTELTSQRRAVAADAVKDADDASRDARIELIATAVLGLLVFAFSARALIRNITRPLQQSVKLLSSVATGDLTQRLDVTREDELGAMAKALNEAVSSMQRALGDVRDSSEAVATASFELSAAGDQISSGAQAQASSLEETSASLAEMTTSVKQNADNAQHAADAARNARGAAEQGGHAVSSVGIAMTDLEAAAKRVVDIITAIDEIAFQTNILALNAAVEAARAGEQGRGFAVVAAEVRSLAQRSASSAKEIRALIADSVVKVENVRTLVDHSQDALRAIVGSVESMSAVVDDIAMASREQATGIDQLNRTVAQMDKVTQSNAAQTEELSGTAQSMSSQAEQLRHLVSRFKVGLVEAAKPSAVASNRLKQRYELARLQDGEERSVSRFSGPSADGEFAEF